jgi:hypothetical protein
MKEIPVVCTLSGPELRERRVGLLRRVRSRMVAAAPLAAGDGYELRFAGHARDAEDAQHAQSTQGGEDVQGDETVAEVLELVRLESRCCAFLRFRVTIEPGGGPVTLEISGPPGGAEILARELLAGGDAEP